MTNGEKIIAILKPRKDQIRIYSNWVEIEIQKLGINFSCDLDWWNIKCNEPSNKSIIYKAKESKEIQEDLDKLRKLNEPTTKNDLGVDCSLDDFIKYCKRTFGVELTVKKSDNPDTYAKLFETTKNDCAEQNGCISCSLDDGDDCCRKLYEESMRDLITKSDLALIHTEGLDEGIRCAMCTNHIKSDRGCDGGCVVDNNMYKAVMDVIEKQKARDNNHVEL